MYSTLTLNVLLLVVDTVLRELVTPGDRGQPGGHNNEAGLGPGELNRQEQD